MEVPGPRLQTGLNRLVDPALKSEGNSLEIEVLVREEKKMVRLYLSILLYLLFPFLFYITSTCTAGGGGHSGWPKAYLIDLSVSSIIITTTIFYHCQYLLFSILFTLSFFSLFFKIYSIISLFNIAHHTCPPQQLLPLPSIANLLFRLLHFMTLPIYF